MGLLSGSQLHRWKTMGTSQPWNWQHQWSIQAILGWRSITNMLYNGSRSTSYESMNMLKPWWNGEFSDPHQFAPVLIPWSAFANWPPLTSNHDQPLLIYILPSHSPSDPLPEEEFRVGHFLLLHAARAQFRGSVGAHIAADHEETAHQDVLLPLSRGILVVSGSCSKKGGLTQQKINKRWWYYIVS